MTFKKLLLVAASLVAFVTASPGFSALPAAPGNVVKLDGLPVVELVSILMREVLRAEFVVTPEVSADRRTASLSLLIGRGDDDRRVVAALSDLGLTVRRRGGVFVVSKASAETRVRDSMSGPGVARLVKPKPLLSVVYTPLYRDPASLALALAAVMPELKIAGTAAGNVDTPDAPTSNAPDMLVFAGDLEQNRAALMLLAQLDLPRPQLMIRATVFEVSTGKSNRSALDIAGSLLGGRLGITAGGGSLGAPGEAVARLALGSFSVALSALSTDSRFKVVSSPQVLARSGTESVLVSGSQVPVLGAVTVPGDGRPAVQSVEYRDSGVTLKVRPSVFEKSIDLDVTQELSNFVRTTTGVDGSPTLNRRSLVNRLSARAGDIFLLGGLVQDRQVSNRSGVLMGLLGSRVKESEKSEILMLLQIDTVPGAPERSEASTAAPGDGLAQ